MARGLDSRDYLGSLVPHHIDITDEFREAAKEVTVAPERAEQPDVAAPPQTGWAREDNGRIRSGIDVGASIGEGIGFSLISIAESLVGGFVGAKPDPKKAREPEAERRPTIESTETIIKEARERQAKEQADADEEWRAKQRGRDGG